MALIEQLRTEGLANGLVGFGVCTVEPFDSVRADIERRREDGLAGRLAFTFRDPATSTDIRASVPWAEHLVVGAWSYVPDAGHPGEPAAGTGRIARFATEDHYVGLRRALDAVAARLRSAGHLAEVLVDDNRLVDRAAAVRAGVGWWGKNTMVLAPRFGPWLLLGSVVTDAPLPTTEPMQRDCGTCAACIPACPTGALVAPGVLDATRCIAYWAQTAGVIPVQFRAAMGDRLYGCDDCLDACPPGSRLLDQTTTTSGRVDLIEVLAAADRTLLTRFGHFYIPRRQPRYLRRNALVAVGNVGGPNAVAVCAGYLGHPDSLLRAHAAWALGRLGGPAARSALREARTRERQESVAAELAAALGGEAVAAPE